MSRTWEPSLWNVSIKKDKASICSFLWKGRSLTLINVLTKHKWPDHTDQQLPPLPSPQHRHTQVLKTVPHFVSVELSPISLPYIPTVLTPISVVLNKAFLSCLILTLHENNGTVNSVNLEKSLWPKPSSRYLKNLNSHENKQQKRIVINSYITHIRL